MQETMTGAEVRKLLSGGYVPKRPSGQPIPAFKGRATRYGARHIPGVMNKTETAYSEVLHGKQATGEVLCWWFETVTLRLAKDCRYTPDFTVFFSDGSLEFVDCKGAGPMDEKSRVKIKMAAQLFPQFGFAIERRRAKKDGGGFVREEFGQPRQQTA